MDGAEQRIDTGDTSLGDLSACIVHDRDIHLSLFPLLSARGCRGMWRAQSSQASLRFAIAIASPRFARVFQSREDARACDGRKVAPVRQRAPTIEGIPLKSKLSLRRAR